MSESETVGPRLTDAEFFGKIDTERPGLEGIAEAIEQENWAEARRLFAAEARASLQPDRFLTIQRTFRGHNFMYEDETVAEAAERIVRGELISCSTPHQFEGQVDWFLNPTFNQYKEWTWQLSRHPEWAVLGERYRETGDERYAEAFVDYFESWVHQALVPEDASGGATLCWRTIEAGIRMGGSWQWALHSFYRSPHFTDDVLIDWYKSVWEHGWRLRNFHRTGNWLIMEMNGLAQIGILYPQFLDAVPWKQYAFDKLAEELDAQVYPDGFQVELSTGYHQVDIRNYGWLMDVCRAYDEPVPEAFHSGLERMHTVNVMMMMPDGRLPDVNDGGWRPVAGLMDGAVAAYPEREDFRWAYTEGREGAPPDETSVAFPYAGYYIMRTSWAPDAVWALFDGGPFGYGHQHEDKLNLLLHAYGHLLLTEAGNYAYDSSEMRRYVLSTRAHNTIRIDGQDQNRRANYDREGFDVTERAGAQWHSTDAYDVVEATYDEGYGPDAARTVTHRRKAIMVKSAPDGLGPFLVAIDRLTPEDGAEHSAQILWHLDAYRATLDGLAVHTQTDETANLALLPAAADGLSVALVAGQELPELQGWMAIKDHQQGQYAPTPTALYELAFSTPLRLVTVLYPTPAGEACPVQAVEAPTDTDAAAIHLVLADGSTIDLSEDAYPLSDE
jgi:hypothetical protein